MALQRRGRGAGHANIWPGFVDAMTGLLLVLMFVLTMFTIVQFVLRDEINGQATQLTEQETQLTQLTDQVASLASALAYQAGRGHPGACTKGVRIPRLADRGARAVDARGPADRWPSPDFRR